LEFVGYPGCRGLVDLLGEVAWGHSWELSKIGGLLVCELVMEGLGLVFGCCLGLVWVDWGCLGG